MKVLCGAPAAAEVQGQDALATTAGLQDPDEIASSLCPSQGQNQAFYVVASEARQSQTPGS